MVDNRSESLKDSCAVKANTPCEAKQSTTIGAAGKWMRHRA
jgi:hypothetical protein